MWEGGGGGGGGREEPERDIARGENILFMNSSPLLKQVMDSFKVVLGNNRSQRRWLRPNMIALYRVNHLFEGQRYQVWHVRLIEQHIPLMVVVLYYCSNDCQRIMGDHMVSRDQNLG